MIKKINIHALLPVLPKGYLNVGGGGDKFSFPSDNKENILSIGHKIKYGEEENMGRHFMFKPGFNVLMNHSRA